MTSPKTILVTGANKGIGYEICRQLARGGARVFLGARDAGRGHAAVGQLKAENPSAHVELLLIDLASTTSIDAAAAGLGAQISSLDVLINNAGILEDRDGTILETDLDLLRRTLETNTFGPLYLTQKLIPLLSAATGGARIVNVSSALGQLHEMSDEYPAYSVSKPPSTPSRSNLPTRSNPGTLPSTRSVPAGCARTWAARTPTSPSRKVPTPRSGWPGRLR